MLLAAALGALDSWAARSVLNPMGVSYLDMGDAYFRGDWGTPKVQPSCAGDRARLRSDGRTFYCCTLDVQRSDHNWRFREAELLVARQQGSLLSLARERPSLRHSRASDKKDL